MENRYFFQIEPKSLVRLHDISYFEIEMKIKTNIYHYIDNNSEFANLNRIHIKFEYIAMMRSRYGK
jgi:hypothetical protein